MHDAYNCSISLANETFLDMQGLTLSLVGFFDLEIIVLDTHTATTILLLLLFA